MKKLIAVLCALTLVFSCTACTSKTSKPADSGIPETTTATQKIDVDLTLLSSTMIYSEVSNMVANPNEYIGKTVKMNGNFSTDENNFYYFCVIADATACCSQGLEFILKGNPSFPDAYPEIGSEITVTGRFESYNEGTEVYYHLVDAVLDA